MQSNYYPGAGKGSRSPPPLQHPKPTHLHYGLPEPPATPVSASGAEPQGYMRFTSTPVGGQQQQHVPYAQHSMGAGYAQPQQQYHAFAGGVPTQGVPLQQQQGQFTPGPIPNFGAWGVNDATAAMGMQLGTAAVAAGQDYMEKNFGRHLPLPLLKHHFNVSNSYVLHKLRLVVFPWRHRPWSRQMRRTVDHNGQTGGWQPPREDINSPDLYIPTMAFVTYILISALKTGLEKRFNPEVLGLTASKALAALLLEFMTIKLGCYFLNIQGPGQVVDVFAYGGYKFIGIIATVIADLLHLGRTVYWVVFLYCVCSNAFFLLRSLRYVVLPDPNTSPSNVSVANSNTLSTSQRGNRVKFLFALSVMQILYMGMLVRV
ncbi:hypothetical protein BOTBODRAFT_115475 [Botryobasidium botryosum FD-172 SS1]|uniref:Protein YIF1 n=1 Tax=Botryobasidium botryosum (strain FD-172 SS1) TaxID=930990 RepID=A0A067M7L7_BOTB1|nr:hypothetical protein BOTBODRAFT_115475 [Botryobasidium botryosum FD-172 SS1]